MCGIAGWLCVPGGEPAPHTLASMSERLAHRGPDDQGTYVDARHGVAIAHRRLSIIDLTAASHQPMVDAGSGVILAYNGELYNFHALRRELEALGHAFRSNGDTEVVLRSYLQWGVACLARFAGMFALALWDPSNETLHLARDAMGIKPLYFIQAREGVFFASEIKAFRAVPGFSGALDPLGVRQYLEFGYVFDPSRTILAGISKLGPGERMEVREGRVSRHVAWFRPPQVEDTRAAEPVRVAELAAVLDEVVQQHLIADVPIALLLSGGLDSSLVGAFARKRGPLRTVTMAFADSAVDERTEARVVSQHVGSEHTEVLINSSDVRAEIERGAWVFDDLFADWGTVSTRLLYRKCRELGIKVVLVGEGADELFGGYDVFRTPGRLGLWQQFRLYQKYAGRRYGHLFGDFHAAMGAYLSQSGDEPFEAVRLFESRRQLPNQYAMKVDKASMAESVEARAPFLDRRVAEYAYRTPREWLLRGGENKYLLRALGRRDGLLPATIAGRAKFGAPLAASWMDDDESFRSFARDRVLDPASQTRALGLDHAMRSYLVAGRQGQGFPRPLSIFRNLAWRLLLLEMWSPHYLTPRAP